MKRNWLFVFGLLFFSCKKDKHSSIITLNDKSITVTESYLLGKWQVNYIKGGICGSCRINRTSLNECLNFLPNQRIIYSMKDSIIADTVYRWSQYSSSQNPLESIKVVQFLDKRGAPYFYEPHQIYNDTLILIMPDHTSPDNNLWGLIKIN